MCKCGDACKCSKEVVKRVKLEELLKTSEGRFLTVVFTKLDGKVRTMNGRFGVQKGVKGVGKAPAAHKGNPYKVLWDRTNKNFRMINLETIKSVAMNGVRYVVD